MRLDTGAIGETVTTINNSIQKSPHFIQSRKIFNYYSNKRYIFASNIYENEYNISQSRNGRSIRLCPRQRNVDNRERYCTYTLLLFSVHCDFICNMCYLFHLQINKMGILLFFAAIISLVKVSDRPIQSVNLSNELKKEIEINVIFAT